MKIHNAVVDPDLIAAYLAQQNDEDPDSGDPLEPREDRMTQISHRPPSAPVHHHPTYARGPPVASSSTGQFELFNPPKNL